MQSWKRSGSEQLGVPDLGSTCKSRVPCLKKNALWSRTGLMDRIWMGGVHVSNISTLVFRFHIFARFSLKFRDTMIAWFVPSFLFEMLGCEFSACCLHLVSLESSLVLELWSSIRNCVCVLRFKAAGFGIDLCQELRSCKFKANELSGGRGNESKD